MIYFWGMGHIYFSRRSLNEGDLCAVALAKETFAP